jgi:Zn-dependent oligopeptidase
MKGILKNTPAGWFVMYSVMRDEITSGYDSLPLYQEIFDQTADQPIIPLVDGKQVEFEIMIETPTLLTVAKLIKEYPELEGTLNLCEDIIEKRTGKMTEEEWQAAENKLKPKYTADKGISFYIEKLDSQRMYSEEEVIDFLQEMNDWPTTFEGRIDIREWFEQFKKK